jgi:transcriptional regulator with XRE-family HTH domain
VINIKDDQVIKAFGKRLKTLRTSTDLSQERLANLAEVPISQVGRIERGEGNPTLSTINALAIALNMSLSELLMF